MTAPWFLIGGFTMGGFQAVAKAAEIPAGEMKLVDLDGDKVVVANVDGTFLAFGNACTHVGGPLDEGDLDGRKVTCPWHASVFDITSGEPLEGPAEESIPIYEVEVAGGEIRVRKP